MTRFSIPRLSLALTLVWALLSTSFVAADTDPDSAERLAPRLAPLESLLGTWELDAAWSNGAKLWSKAEYKPALGGQFIEVKTWVRDGDGPVYLRYHSFMGLDEQGAVIARNFNHDGSTKNVDYQMPAPGVLVTEWAMGGTAIRERYEPTDSDTARWQVWMRPENQDAAEWVQAMDGAWRRVETTPVEKPVSVNESVRPIDHRQFVASGHDLRSLELATTIAAPAATVYAAFTDAAAFKKAYGPDNEALKANIDLAIGGRYEWLFDGQIGSNGCQVLSYVPGRMISFTWNAPPVQAENREKRTWVVVEFSADEEGGTQIELTHLGFGEGEQWNETLAYFEKAWDHVLSTLKANLEA